MSLRVDIIFQLFLIVAAFYDFVRASNEGELYSQTLAIPIRMDYLSRPSTYYQWLL